MYGAVNPAVLARVPSEARRILDLGCGDGSLGAVLRKRQAANITGVTADPKEAAVARTRLERVIEDDLDVWIPPADRSFDVVIASHVLEHLKNPGRLLERLVGTVRPEGKLLVALPNAVYWRQRIRFALGSFRYESGGIMDETHLRFFDRRTARELVEDNGWSVELQAETGGFPGSRWMGPLRKIMDAAAVGCLPGVFSTQFVFVCRPLERV